MPARYRKSEAAAGLLVLSAPLLVGAISPAQMFSTMILAAHNRERTAIGVPPLRWNAALAGSAQRWADHLAATGSFEHAPESPTEAEGENLWAGTRGHYSIEARVDAWVREKRYFTPGTFPRNSTTGKVEDVGHYTQLIWRNTQQVGCAQASGAREDVLVCRYSSPGNYIGERVL